MDAIITATALAHDLAVWTNDDFAVLAELSPELRLDGSVRKHADDSQRKAR